MAEQEGPGPASLASGQAKLDWVRPRMPLLAAIRRRFEAERPLAGERVAMSLHLEAKTALLAEVLAAGGAAVSVTSSNPLSAQDDVAAALASAGITVYARRGTSPEEFDVLHHRVLDSAPTLVVDDGGELVARLVTVRRELVGGVKGGAEETTTGVLRLRALSRAGGLPFPMVAVNDAPMKHLFDNRYGTGQSAWEAVLRHTNLSLAGARVVVAGYGWCGRGLAERARGLGAHVTVTEVDPVRANEAWMDGFAVGPLAEACHDAQFVVTATGCRDVVGEAALLNLPEGAILANAGHFDVEIDMAWLRAHATPAGFGRDPDIQGWRLPNGRTVYVLAEGRLVNLAAGDGHPVEIMDMSFALQALTLEDLAKRPRAPGLYPVEPAINEWVAQERLRALGVRIDTLTEDQARYLASWNPEARDDA